MDKEELLFEIYKDTVMTGNDSKRAELQKKYPDVNISNVHRRIVNYQVKKYGTSLNSSRTVWTYEKASQKAKERGKTRIGK